MIQQTLLPSTGPRLLVEFTVVGAQKPQGSKIAQPVYRNGKAVMKNGRPVLIVRDDNRDLQEWRRHVARQCAKHFPDTLIAGPVRLEIEFRVPRPNRHFGTGRNAGVLKSHAPRHPIVRPDLDKLARAICDSLTAVVWCDDAQVVDLVLSKRYGPRFDTTVKVYAID